MPSLDIDYDDSTTLHDIVIDEREFREALVDFAAKSRVAKPAKKKKETALFKGKTLEAQLEAVMSEDLATPPKCLRMNSKSPDDQTTKKAKTDGPKTGCLFNVGALGKTDGPGIAFSIGSKPMDALDVKASGVARAQPGSSISIVKAAKTRISQAIRLAKKIDLIVNVLGPMETAMTKCKTVLNNLGQLKGRMIDLIGDAESIGGQPWEFTCKQVLPKQTILEKMIGDYEYIECDKKIKDRASSTPADIKTKLIADGKTCAQIKANLVSLQGMLTD